jgi:hypothetical protein
MMVAKYGWGWMLVDLQGAKVLAANTMLIGAMELL